MGKASRTKTERRVVNAIRSGGHSLKGNSNWTPLERAYISNDPGKLYDSALDGEVFKNSLYTVFRRVLGDGVAHLSIKRNDREAIHDWRDFQRIKNELCGPEWEAVELYPAESRLVDTSNQYHLWACRSGFNLGWDKRVVTDTQTIAGALQRPLPSDWEATPVQDILQAVSGIQAVRQAARDAGVDLTSGGTGVAPLAESTIIANMRDYRAEQAEDDRVLSNPLRGKLEAPNGSKADPEDLIPDDADGDFADQLRKL